MADIEMKLTNWNGAMAGAAKQQLLQAMEKKYTTRVQQDGNILTKLENTYGGADTKASIE